MSNDSSAPAAVTVASSHEAHYDAVYAAVTSTERGRWFLTEYANRSRTADADLVVAALARIEAAIAGGRPQASASHRDRAAALASNEPVSAALPEAAPLHKIAAAAERLLDISFRMRESAVEAALCEDIEAAAREIYEACRAGTPRIEVPRTDAWMPGEASADAATSERAGAVMSPIDRAAELKPARGGLNLRIDGPDFVFHSPDQEPGRAGVAPSGAVDPARALLPETQFHADPQNKPAEPFEAANSPLDDSIAAAEATASAVSFGVPNDAPAQQPQSPLSVGASSAVRTLARPAQDESLREIRGLSEEDLLALFG